MMPSPPRSDSLSLLLLLLGAVSVLSGLFNASSVWAQNRSNASVGLDQEGRYELLFATTALGFQQGALLPAAFGVDDADVYSTTVLAGGAVGFFAPLLLTRRTRITEAAGTMAIYGNAQGLAHGGLLTLLLFGEDLDGSGEVAAGLTAALAAGETYLAYRAADQLNLRAGTAEGIAYGSLAGAFIGGAAASTVTGVGASQDVSDDVAIRSFSAAALGGTVAGSYLGYRIAQAEDFSQGDARVWLLGGAIAVQAAGAGLLLAEEEGTRAVPAVLGVSALGGLALSRRLVRGREFTTGQANIIALGTLAGSLLGRSLAATTDAGDEQAFAYSAAGSLLGFGVTYATYARDASAPTAFGWEVEVNPFGLYGALSGRSFAPPQNPSRAFTLRRQL